MAANDPRLDLVSVAVIVLTAWVGRETAEAVGTYAVIAASGLVGAGFGLSRWRACSTRTGAAYLAGMTAAALILTMPAVLLATHTWPGIEARWLVAPVATLIAWIGHDWPALLRRVGAATLTLVTRRAESIDRGPDQSEK